ncbi:MAG: DinB family protein [Acidobacteriaceae bacterium]|nr:DinB family protein [Acidobacteriaceae bacterium]
MRKFLLTFFLAAVATLPVRAQNSADADNLKSIFLKHLQTSRDFTVKVAEAMPEENYSFKLTPGQMSFGGQLTHLSQALIYFLSAFAGEKPNPGKPASESKADVIAYVKSSYEKAIAQVSQLTPEQIHKTYKFGGQGSMTGVDLLLGMFDHTTHHRASAEMYLRAKGITPPQYEF